jgi:carboxyl-terminal processing protease
MKSTFRFILKLVTLALLVAACNPFGSGPTATTSPPPTATTSIVLESGRALDVVGCDSAPEEMEILCEAYDLIQRHYVDALDDEFLAEAASNGLAELDMTESTDDLTCAIPADPFAESCNIAAERADTSTEAAEAMVAGLANYALDANSVYLDEDALELIEQEQGGEIEGIGALVTAEDRSSGEPVQCSIVTDTCRLMIVSIISGSPAEAAGVQRDDQIVGVDGQDITDWTIDEVTAAVRGPAETDVTLTLRRGEGTLDVTITRAAIVIPVVQTEAVGRVGYLRLNIFTNNADEQFEEAVNALLDEGIDSLVVDLRNNPGGLLDTAIAITSQFLPDGDVVVTQSPDSDTTYEVTGRVTVPEDTDVVFVVNRGSASASEVVSAVLQERGRATVVGENTFGKNTVQQRFGLSNGGALKLTIARWITPGGLDFGGVGVTPDHERAFEPDATPEEIVATALAVG